jgi:D-3-phosphoglycerate dehydrogenase
MQYSDVPGMVGKIGTILGEHEVNIARMEVGRIKQGDQAVILLTLDDPASLESLEALKTSIHPTDLRSITIS